MYRPKIAPKNINDLYNELQKVSGMKLSRIQAMMKRNGVQAGGEIEEGWLKDQRREGKTSI